VRHEGGVVDMELATLAATGATTVVGLMVTETWTQAKTRLVRLLSRGGDEDAVEEELQETRDLLLGARESEDELVVADVEAAWRVRLRRLLQSDPEALEQLRALLAELAPESGDGDGAMSNTVNVGVQHGPVVQARDVSGLTIHGGPGTERGAGAQ
jgi:hypothetical protein